MSEFEPGRVIFRGPRAEVLGAEFGEERKTAEFQTDKDPVKVVACNECARPVAVNAFYSDAKVMCTSCKPRPEKKERPAGTAQQIHVGKTDPAKVANLADVLINKQSAVADCPLCAEPMELKKVTHNPYYGPSKAVGKGQYVNSTGETALLQCNHCKTITSYTTTCQTVLRRRNEPKQGTRQPEWPELLGEREDAA